MLAARLSLRCRALCAIGVVALAASPVLANPGAAGLAVGIHVILGCLLIGLAEALIAMAFGARWWSLPVIVFANYFSAIIGIQIASRFFHSVMAMIDDEPLRAAVPASWITFAAFILLGAVMESPFFFMCFKNSVAQWRRVAGAVVVGTGVTNLGLTIWYANAWADSLVTSLEVIDSPGLIASELEDETPWVYFIDGEAVRRIRLDGADEQLVRTPTSSLDDAQLLTERVGERFHLFANVEEMSWNEPTPGLLEGQSEHTDRTDAYLSMVAANVGAAASTRGPDEIWNAHGPRARPYEVADLRPDDEQVQHIRSHWDGMVGITIEDEAGRRSLALDNGFIRRSMTPFGVSVLSGDILVFELNHEYEDQSRGIYLVSLRSSRIARLTDGRSPVVVFEQPIDGWTGPEFPPSD